MGIENMRVLVVDDYDTMIKIIKNLLQQIGCTEIETAKSGEQALEIVNEGAIDFVISDWNMEPMSGLEFLKAVRSHQDPKIKSLPFIMVTAESKPENVVAAKQAGVNNYIVKPFNADTLKTKIDSVLAKAA